MIYHILPDNKFIDEFIEVSEQIKDCEVKYIVFNKSLDLKLVKSKLIYSVETNFVFFEKILKDSNKGDKIFLHGLDEDLNIVKLVGAKKIDAKLYWIVWGAELYNMLDFNVFSFYDYFIGGGDNIWKNFLVFWKMRLFERNRNRNNYELFLVKLSGIMHYNKYDIDLINKFYSTNIEMITFFYKNMIEWDSLSKYIDCKDTDSKNVLLGNSGYINNNHFSILRKFKARKFKDYKINTPLSYGYSPYIKRLVNIGRKWLGDKFIPLMDFVQPENYLEFLSKMSFVIMNHKRSQAMGNINILLALGKPIFFNRKCTTTFFLKDLNVVFFYVEDFFSSNPCELTLSSDQIISNRKIIKMTFSDELFRENLINIYNR